MNLITKKIAYLQGLANDQGVGETKKGQLLTEVIHLISDVVEDLQNQIDDLEGYVNILKEDLSDLGEYTYDDDDSDGFKDFEDFGLDDYDMDLYGDLDGYDEFEARDKECDYGDCCDSSLDEE